MDRLFIAFVEFCCDIMTLWLIVFQIESTSLNNLRCCTSGRPNIVTPVIWFKHILFHLHEK